MFFHRINQIDGHKITVNGLSNDPHGQFICAYDDQRDVFYVVQTLSILKHFLVYRYSFHKNHKYSQTQSLPHLLSFTVPKQGIVTSVTIYPKDQNQNQIILVVKTSSLQTVQINIKNAQIKHRQVYQFTVDIVKATIFENYLYAYLHDGAKAKINLTNKNSNFIKKKFSEPKLIAKDSLLSPKQSRKQNQGQIPIELFTLIDDRLNNTKLWQSINGHLMLNQRVISSDFTEENCFSTSFDEFIHKEAGESHPIKYELSACQNYVIGFNCKIGRKLQGSQFILRSSKSDWNQIAVQLYRPEINQFWTYKQKYQNLYKKGHQGIQNQDHILIAEYDSHSNQIKIFWLVVSLRAKRKLVYPKQNVVTKCKRQWQQQQKIKYKSERKGILLIQNIKHPIHCIRWISLTALLFYDHRGNLFFLQFSQELLQNNHNSG